jgi:hypothetical protein
MAAMLPARQGIARIAPVVDVGAGAACRLGEAQAEEGAALAVDQGGGRGRLVGGAEASASGFRN